MICLIVFYGIPTLVDYSMQSSLYTNILNIYDSVWLGFMDIPTLIGNLIPHILDIYTFKI